QPDERPSSRKRQKYVPQPIPEIPEGEAVPYAELHAHSNFSFLDGSSSPEELLEEATRLNLHALALTDHDGMYGVVHLAEAAGEWMVLTGCRKGDVRLALAERGERAAEHEVARLAELFGHDNVLVELIDQGGPRDSTDNDILTRIAGRLGLPTVATNNVHYA